MTPKEFLDALSKGGSVNFRELVERSHTLGVTQMYVSEDADEQGVVRMSVAFILLLGEENERI